MTDNLLFSLSSYSSLNFDAFERVVQLLYKQEIGQLPDNISFRDVIKNTLYALDELSHCEIDFDKRKIYVCPPCLTLLPQFGLPKAILTGARTPEVVQKCQEYLEIHKENIYGRTNFQSCSDYLAPHSISFEAVSGEYLQSMADEIGVKFQTNAPASWLLLNYSASIADVKSKLNYKERPDFSWRKKIFNDHQLVFSDWLPVQSDGIQLAEYTNRYTLQKTHLLWHNGNAAEIDRNWGRYLILSENNRQVITYDFKRYVLGVPITVPLPKLLSRAAVLCTGLIPLRVPIYNTGISDMQFYVRSYQSVSPDIARIIAEKLGQNLNPGKILIPREYLYA